MGIFDLFKKKKPKEEKDMNNQLDNLLGEVNQIKAEIKKETQSVEQPKEEVLPPAPKKRGRPKGSKNKPKVSKPAQNLMTIVCNQVIEFNIEDSQVHGKGMIAKSHIPKDAILSETHQLGVDGGFDPIFPFGFFVNHSVSNANAFLATFVDKLYLITTREIPKGSEILIDYRERPDLEQPQDDWNK